MANEPERTQQGQVDVAIIKAFAESWVCDDYSHLRHTVRAFCASASDSTLLQSTLTQLVVHDIKKRWASLVDSSTSGRPHRVAWYLEAIPDLSDTAVGPQLELLVAEFESRLSAGDHPKLAEYESEFGEYADTIRLLKERVQPKLAAQLDDTHTGAAYDVSTMPGGKTANADGDLQPRQLGDYELKGELARGGMGVVFRAYHTKLHRTVALKMILAGKLAGEEEVKRFYSEAESAAKLDHPGIVPIYEVGHADGTHYFTMALVEGTSLSQKIGGGPMPVRDAAEMLRQVSKAVGYAHQSGVIHRDLKPSNILISTSGTPRVTDFGLAKSVQGDSGMTATGQVLGTPSYMPPEQAEGKIHEVDSRSDIYSLGAVLYCMLTGRPPFHASTVIETLRNVIDQPPIAPRLLNPSVDRDLETICLKCLEKRKQDRFESTDELCDELERYINGETIRSRRVGIVTRAARWCRRKPLVVALAASVLIAATIGVFAITVGRTAVQTRKLADAEREFATQLESLQPTSEFYAAQTEAIDVIEKLSPSAARRAQSKLDAQFALAIESQLRRPRQTVEQLDAMQPIIALLDSSLSARLQELLSQRRTTWQLVASSSQSKPDFNATALQKDSRGFRAQVSDRLIRIQGRVRGTVRAIAPSVKSRVSCDGDIRAVVTFDTACRDFSEFGVQLRAADETAYDFVVRVQRLGQIDKATTIAEALSEGALVSYEIRRGLTPLVRRSLKPDQFPDGSVRIEVMSAGDSLLMRLGDLPPLQFRDPYPLIGNSGVFGLRLPAGLFVTEYEVFQRRAQTISPLESADLLLARGKLEDALLLFNQQAANLSDPQLQQEARFKAARCLLGLDRDDEAVDILKGISTQSGDRWPPLAGTHLWALFLNRDDYQQADAMFQFISGRYEFDQLASLVPEDLREEILLKTDQPFRSLGMTLRYDPKWVANMERSAAIDRLLSADGVGTLETQLQLALAYRNTGRFDDALKVLETQLHSTDVGFGGNVYRHYTRCLRQLGRNQEAIDYLTQLIETKTDEVRYVASLHISRGWCYAADENWVSARFDFLRALTLCQRYEIQSSLHEQVAAYFALGMLAHRRGHSNAAAQYWRKGWAKGRELLKTLPTIANTSALFALVQGGLIGDFTPEDFDQIARITSKGAGNAQFMALTGMMPSQTFAQAINHAWQTPDGIRLAEDLAFDRLPISQRYALPVKHMGTSIVGISSSGYPPARENMRVMRAMVDSAFEGVVIDGTIGNSQMLQTGMAWKGIKNFLGWDGIKATLPKERMGLFAYVMAHRYVRRNQDADVPALFRDAIEGLASLPDEKAIAESDFKLWQEQRCRLVAINESEQDVELECVQKGQVVHSETIPPGASEYEVLLAPGRYQVRLRNENHDIRLSSASIAITRGSSRELTVKSRWNAPPRNSTIGIVPRPTRDRDGRRWQLFRPDNTASSKCVAWHPADQLVAIADHDEMIRILDAETGAVQRFLPGHRAPIREMAWLPDGVHLASCSYDSTIVWDTKRAIAVAELPSNGKHERIAVDPLGHRIAIGSYQRLLIWDLNDHSVKSLMSTKGWSSGIAWHPDGKQLATGWSGLNGIRVVNIESGISQHFQIAANETFGTRPEFSHDGKKLAAFNKSELFVWDLAQPNQTSHHVTVDRNMSVVKWSSDDKKIVVSHGHGPLRVLNIADGQWSDHPAKVNIDGGGFDLQETTGAIIRASSLPSWEFIGGDDQDARIVRCNYRGSGIRSISWCSESRLTLALSSGQILDLDPTSKSHAEGAHVKNLKHLRWNPAGDTLLCSSDGGKLHLLNAQGEVTSSADLGKMPAPQSLTWNPTDKQFAVVAEETTIQLFQNDFSKPTRTIDPPDVARISGLSWSPDGKRLAIGTSFEGVRIMTVESQAISKSAFRDMCRVVAWKDGNVISGDGRIEINRGNSRETLLRGRPADLGRLLRLIPSSDGSTISIWENGRIRKSSVDGVNEQADCSQTIRDIAFHPASNQLALATGERTIEFYDATTLRPTMLFVLLADKDCAWFTPAGRLIKTSSELSDRLLIQRWSADGETELQPFSGH